MMMRPAVSSSSPATARNSVDLPHPDGPTITVNSPWATSIDTPFRTSVAPKLLRAPSIDNPAMIPRVPGRSEEHTSELQSLMRISYVDFCLNKKKTPLAKTKYTATNTLHQ